MNKEDDTKAYLIILLVLFALQVFWNFSLRNKLQVLENRVAETEQRLRIDEQDTLFPETDRESGWEL